MNLTELKHIFYSNISQNPPNEWEIEEYLSKLLVLPNKQQIAILEQVPAVWPISHSLCYNYLSQAKTTLSYLETEQLQEWIVGMLDVYETAGLRGAFEYMEDIDKYFLCKKRGESGVRLEKIRNRLQTYVQGISGENLKIGQAAVPCTDGETIFLPEKLNVLAIDHENHLLYKFLASYQVGHIVTGTYRLNINENDLFVKNISSGYGRLWKENCDPLTSFFSLFPDQELISDIFMIVRSSIILEWLSFQLPGLFKDFSQTLAQLFISQNNSLCVNKNDVIASLHTSLIQRWVNEKCYRKKNPDLIILKSIKLLTSQFDSTDISTHPYKIASEIYRLIREYPGDYEEQQNLLFGRLLKEEAYKVRLQRRVEAKNTFIESLAALIISKEEKSGVDKEAQHEDFSSQKTVEKGRMLLIDGDADTDKNKQSNPQNGLSALLLGDSEIDLPEEMQNLVSKITNDLGEIPQEYISSAAGMAGQGILENVNKPMQEETPLTGYLVYDEWDFRRNAFRKNWCHLHEKSILPIGGTFVQKTLQQYNGLLLKLRRQFEMMRSQERYIRRQKEGDDIDLDAVIEYLSDMVSSTPNDEGLYVRLSRDERDIAAIFLVDMSGSTEGWINTAIKEALLLMGESLSILGDRFAVYGFSGMRRHRSELFLIKGLEEPYNDEIKDKIAAISAQEYTRMGPPIRHLTKILSETDAKVRLMITLSDGKPEDYDDYKGQYAIEDTRHALIEAKSAGIHPFCITIDKKSHDYIAHMYGDVNYIFLNDVRFLPARMPAIYRGLTS